MKIRRRSNRHRNPVPGMGQLVELLTNGLFAILGGVIARGVPEWFLSSSNNGVQGYLYNLAVTIAEWYLAHSAGLNPDHALAIGTGGAAFTASRVIEDYFGATTINFPSVAMPGGAPAPASASTPKATLGAYGGSDVAFSFSRRPRLALRGMGGMYAGSDFVVPTESLNIPQPGGAVAALPAAGQSQASAGRSADMWGGSDIWG